MKVYIFYNWLYKNDTDFIKNEFDDFPLDIKNTINRYKDEKEKSSKIISKLLLKKGVEHLFPGQKNILNKIKRTDTNKPFVENLDCYFSSTHSHDLCIVAICEQAETGIDAEFIKLVDLHLMQEWMHKNEIQFLKNNTNPLEVFYQIWTKKEAIIKAAGCGVEADLRSIDTTNEQVLFNGRLFYSETISLNPEYKINVVATSVIDEIEASEMIFRL